MKRLKEFLGLCIMVSTAITVQSRADSPIALTCNGDGSKNTLVHSNLDGSSVELVEFEFGSSPFVPPHLSCIKWVSNLSRQKWFLGIKNELSPISLIGPDTDGKGRLPLDTAWKVYQFCAEDKDCKIRFPFNMGPWTLQGKWASFWKEENTTASECLETPITPPKKAISSEDLFSKFKKVIGNGVKFWSTVDSDLASEIIKVSKKSHTVLVSTMTISETQVKLLRAHVDRYPKLSIYITADFSVMATDTRFAKILRLQTERLRILPVFNFPRHLNLYHIKGAVALGSKSSFYIHTSGNLKGTGGSRMIDLGFTSEHANLSKSFAKVFFQETQNICQNINYFKCSTDARLQKLDFRKFLLEGSAQRFCEQIFSDPKVAALGANLNDYFLLSEEYDIPGLLIQEISKAKKSIELITHHFTHSRIKAKLKELSEKGIKVVVMEGAYKGATGKNRTLNRVPGSVGGLPVHTNAIIIDGTRMVWGSGNFSKGGLERNREAFFFTESKRMIKKVRNLIKSK